jgi:hypothetical protein
VTASAAVWRERLSAFVARKEADARVALLPFVTDVDEGGDAFDRIESTWTRAFFDGPFYASRPADHRLPATSLVFVQSRDANTGAPDPSALGGGDTDKHLVYEGLSRVAARAVFITVQRAGSRSAGCNSGIRPA